MVNFIKSLAEVKEYGINFVTLIHMFRDVGDKLYQLTLAASAASEAMLVGIEFAVSFQKFGHLTGDYVP